MMRRFIQLAGLVALVAIFSLWRYANIAQAPVPEERPSSTGEQGNGVRPGTHFEYPLKSPPRIIPLSPRSLTITPQYPGIGPPKRASFEAIASNHYGERVLFQLAENPRIHVLDYESLHVQGRALNRIAAFIEWREAPKERVLDDQALTQMIERTSENPDTLFFGHDYRATDLARFFTSAQRSGILLNEEEQSLLALLIDQGFMRADREGFTIIPPEKVLIAIPRTQADNPKTPQNESITTPMRKTILSHELGHGEFFTNPDYVQYCKDFWRDSLSVSQREAFTRFLASVQHYDVRNEYLLINEFQAYLAYSGVDGYFFGYDVVAGISAEEMAQLRKQFIAHSPAHFRPVQESSEEIAQKHRTQRLQ
jgi:hypothetical protein